MINSSLKSIVKRFIFFAILCITFLNLNAQSEISWNDVSIQKTKDYTTLTGKVRQIPDLTERQSLLLSKSVVLEGFVIGLTGGGKDSYTLCNYESLEDADKEDFIMLNIVFEDSETKNLVKSNVKFKVEGILEFNEFDMSGRNFTLSQSKFK